jgi:hypothetical protein
MSSRKERDPNEVIHWLAQTYPAGSYEDYGIDEDSLLDLESDGENESDGDYDEEEELENERKRVKVAKQGPGHKKIEDKKQKERERVKLANQARRKDDEVRNAEAAKLKEKYHLDKKSSPGAFTNGVTVKDPKIVLDPLDPELEAKIQQHVKFGEGYIVVNTTKEAKRFMARADVQQKVNSILEHAVAGTDIFYDDDRRIEWLEENWVLAMCPYLSKFIDRGGKFATEVSLMKVEQTARMQALHMDSDLLKINIWRDGRTGFSANDMKSDYEHCPLEIIVALTDNCITRVIPNSQWVGLMTDEEYARFQPAQSSAMKLKKGQALIFHPNLIHSGCMALKSDFDCKVHAKILAGSKGKKWIPFKWNKNETYFIDTHLPKERRGAFARWKRHIPYREFLKRKAFEYWLKSAHFKKWEKEELPLLLAARESNED